MLPGLRKYDAPFKAIAVSAAIDVFEVNASSTKITWITGIEFGQYTDFADAQDELLSCTWIQAHSTSGSGGASVTPNPHGSDAAYGGTVERTNTTQATGGSPIDRRAFSWNVRAGYVMHWDPGSWLMVPSNGGRVVLAQTAPADSITMNGTIYLAEAG
jgi:hypothetical protein